MKPPLKAYMAKTGGRQRPLGVPVLEDKIVQRATVEVLNAVYKTDSLGFSCGVRSRRSQHQALDALSVGPHSRKVNWVDADIRDFSDTIDHGRLVKLIERWIADQRVVLHVNNQQWPFRLRLPR